jgi:F-type H+-transporting ATPase subunit epsilon
MADTTKKTLRVVVVTPEKAVLDEAAELVTLPLYDGEFGIMANHAPFVAQLGPGELRIKLHKGADDPTGLDRNLVMKNLFIDGGFVQVANNTINILTQYARAKADVTETLIASERAKSDALPTTNDAERATKAKMTARLAAMTRLAKKA